MSSQPQGHLSRRAFLAASAAAAGSAAAIASGQPVGATRPVSPAPEQTSDQLSDKTDRARGPRMKVAELLPPSPGPLWRLVKQCGVDHVVGTLGANARSADGNDHGEPPWSRPALERAKQLYDEGGFKLDVIEWRPPLTRTKLGLPGRDEEIETVCELVRNMGAVDSRLVLRVDGAGRAAHVIHVAGPQRGAGDRLRPRPNEGSTAERVRRGEGRTVVGQSGVLPEASASRGREGRGETGHAPGRPATVAYPRRRPNHAERRELPVASWT